MLPLKKKSVQIIYLIYQENLFTFAFSSQANNHSTYNFMHDVILPQLAKHSALELTIYRIFHIKYVYEMTT